ncbi:MAG: DUF1080 domain-containing protein [Ginsengibacter sp.]
MPGKINYLIGFLICALSFYNCATAQTPNALTAKETQEGWKLLFDGKDLKGWHAYHEKVIGNVWRVGEGNIMLNKNKKSLPRDYADLLTNEEFGNFDLKIEWKMRPCSNSGVLFYVDEAPQYKNTYESGPEMQIADLACNDDGRILKCRAGDLYDLISADTEWVNKSSLWNEYEIKSNNGHLEFFMNGHKTIDTQIWDNHWREMIQNSKFKEWTGYGTFKKGHIALQGLENGMIWFRNIKIRRL